MSTRGPRPFAVAPKHTFTVNSTSDIDNLASSNTNHVCKTAGGKCTLRGAISAANHETSGVDEVVVSGGTYTLTVTSP